MRTGWVGVGGSREEPPSPPSTSPPSSLLTSSTSPTLLANSARREARAGHRIIWPFSTKKEIQDLWAVCYMCPICVLQVLYCTPGPLCGVRAQQQPGEEGHEVLPAGVEAGVLEGEEHC